MFGIDTDGSKQAAIAAAVLGIGGLAFTGMPQTAKAQEAPSPQCINEYHNPWVCWPYRPDYYKGTSLYPGYGYRSRGSYSYSNTRPYYSGYYGTNGWDSAYSGNGYAYSPRYTYSGESGFDYPNVYNHPYNPWAKYPGNTADSGG